VLWAASYTAWAEVDLLHAAAIDNPIRLQGQYADAETGLSYNRHRYFCPHAGQFISQDPLGLSAGIHPYQMAPSSLGWLDPLGLAKCKVSKAAKTLPNTTRGWRVGDPINNLTSAGNVPSWNTVRARFWKNEAAANAANYSETNLVRMQRGLAPQRVNPSNRKLESMELHHTPAQRDGGLFDVQKVWPDEHAAIDPFRHTGN
jgi:RHS repeat-associated protein